MASGCSSFMSHGPHGPVGLISLLSEFKKLVAEPSNGAGVILGLYHSDVICRRI